MTSKYPVSSPAISGTLPSDGRSGEPASKRSALVLVCMAALSSIVMARQMPDDAYIYLRIAQNIAHRGEWAFNPGVPVNAATSPLYAVFLSVLVTLHLPGLTTPLLLSSILGLSALALATYRGMLSYGPGAAMLAAFAASSFPALLRSEGMETSMYLACIAMTALAVEAGNEYAIGVLAGLTALGRPEGAIIVPLALGTHWWRSGRLPWRGLILSLIPLGLWISFCLHTFHTIVPHTMKIKAMQSALPSWGRPWFIDFLLQLRALLLLAPLGLIGVFLVGRDFRRNLFAGIVIAFAIVQVTGYTIMRAPPSYFWYAAPGGFAYLLTVVVGIVAALKWMARHKEAPAKNYIHTRLVACTCGCALLTIGWEYTHSYPYRSSPDYIASGRWLKQHANPSDWVAADEIGYIGLYSGLPVRDMLGLADPEALSALQQHRWDFWFTDKGEPRYILIHTPAWFGEPGVRQTLWPASTLNTYQTSYHLAFTSGNVSIMEHN